MVYHVWLKRIFELRGQTEQKISINVNNDEEEKGSILSKEGYMIELGRTPSSELNFSDVDSLDSTHPSSWPLLKDNSNPNHIQEWLFMKLYFIIKMIINLFFILWIKSNYHI